MNVGSWRLPPARSRTSVQDAVRRCPSERVAGVAVVTLDLSFLALPLAPMPAPSRAVTIWDIVGEGWRETRVDMTLQVFLDPNEWHGLDVLVMDALLKVLDGVPSIGWEENTGVGTTVSVVTPPLVSAPKAPKVTSRRWNPRPRAD